jgi:NADPH-dependent 2,4-dienoyl-CoA reductase/sulfur reductase-like enzyme
MAAVEYLIIGGGHAGVTAAATLRKSGAQGQLLILSAEPEYPYLRYTLSKDFLQGKPRAAGCCYDRRNSISSKIFS